MAMDIYNLTKVASMTSHPPLNDITYGFNIIGEHGHPLVAFSYERQEEAASRIARSLSARTNYLIRESTRHT
jgi:hypothetical protein